MTLKNVQISSKLLAMSIMAVLLTIAVTSVIPNAHATATCDGSGNHCYANYKKGISNRGGYGTIAINSGNSVQSGYGIANPIWIKFTNNEWIEAGWEKGSFLPCSSTTAKFYWYETVGSTSSSCIGTTSGSTMVVKISDDDLNDTYSIFVNGVYKNSVVKTSDAVSMETGGESTHASNVLTGGEDSGLVYYTTGGVPTWWGSSSLTYSGHMHSYTDTRTSPYTDYQYTGP